MVIGGSRTLMVAGSNPVAHLNLFIDLYSAQVTPFAHTLRLLFPERAGLSHFFIYSCSRFGLPIQVPEVTAIEELHSDLFSTL